MSKKFHQFALKYSFRSLSRNKRRTFLTIMTVALSVAVTIVASRYSTAIMLLWKNGASDTGAGHAQIHKKGYWQKQEGVEEKLTLKMNSKMQEKLQNDSDVIGFAPRIRLEGIFAAMDKSIYFLGLGVKPSEEIKVSNRLFNPENDPGHFVVEDSFSGVTIGQGLADTLGLKLGDEATLISNTIDGAINGLDVVVEGIVDVPLPSFSKRVVYMHIDFAQELIRLNGGVTEFAVKLKKDVSNEEWVAKNKAFVESFDAEIRGWWEIQPIIRSVEKIWHSVVGLISFLLFLSAGLSVLNIIFMLVSERTVEIGTLMAIGAKHSSIKWLFTMESGLIGFFGGAAGVIIGNSVVFIMGLWGVPFESPFGSGLVRVHPVNHIPLSILIGSISVLICVFAARSPAKKASLVEPVKAFRGQMT